MMWNSPLKRRNYDRKIINDTSSKSTPVQLQKIFCRLWEAIFNTEDARTKGNLKSSTQLRQPSRFGKVVQKWYDSTLNKSATQTSNFSKKNTCNPCLLRGSTSSSSSTWTCAILGGSTSPLLSPCTIMMMPIDRVVIAHEFWYANSGWWVSGSSYEMLNMREKFWPRWWDVAACKLR